MTEIKKTVPKAAWALIGLVGLGLVASALGKLSGAAAVVENFEKFHLGAYRVPIGLIELTCAVLFLVPRTSSLGTLLVTGYFGGAIVAHLTQGSAGEAVPAMVLGLLAWGGNYLRNPSMFESLKG